MKKHYIFTNFLSRLLLSAFCFLPFYMWAQNPYVITGSDTQFTATNNGSTIATNKPIQEVIDAIKLNALGADCTIQFGTGVSTINTGTANITFDGGAIGKDWGLVTLTGKLTSACSGYNKGPVYLTNGVSINSQADITGAASGDFAVTFFTNSTGTLTISGGTVLLNATYGMAVYNASTGTVNICGGIVEGRGANAMAICSSSTGKIMVSGNAGITSNATNEILSGTIHIADGGGSGACLEITGGTVENTANSGIAITSKSTRAINISGGTVSATAGQAVSIEKGTIAISGGTVSATAGQAVYTYDGTITISGGTVSATTGEAIYIQEGHITISGGTVSATTGFAVYDYDGSITISGGTVSATTGFAAFSALGVLKFSRGIAFAYGMEDMDVIKGEYIQSDNAVIVAWNADAGTTTYDAGTSDDIYKLPAVATVVWAKQGSENGISVAYNTTTGFIPIEGITVTGVGIDELRNMNYELCVFPNPTTGELGIRNCELGITSIEVFDTYGRKLTSHSSSLTSHSSPLISINISHLPAGVYFVKINTEAGEVIKKVMKQ